MQIIKPLGERVRIVTRIRKVVRKYSKIFYFWKTQHFKLCKLSNSAEISNRIKSDFHPIFPPLEIQLLPPSFSF
jgi:hypothetical protein